MIDTGNELGTVNCHRRSGNAYGDGCSSGFGWGWMGNGAGGGLVYQRHDIADGMVPTFARVIVPDTDAQQTLTNVITFFRGAA